MCENKGCCSETCGQLCYSTEQPTEPTPTELIQKVCKFLDEQSSAFGEDAVCRAMIYWERKSD